MFKLLPGVSSIRRVLVAGFAILLAVWMFAGYELIRALADVERRVTAEHAAYAEAADALSLIRRNPVSYTHLTLPTICRRTPVARRRCCARTCGRPGRTC